MSKKHTQKEVLDRFKKVHGDRYDYSLVDYKGRGKKVIIVCRVHGDFPQVPVSHWLGAGCPDCGLIQRKEKRQLSINSGPFPLSITLDISPSLKVRSAITLQVILFPFLFLKKIISKLLI